MGEYGRLRTDDHSNVSTVVLARGWKEVCRTSVNKLVFPPSLGPTRRKVGGSFEAACR
jgi:hypothetical protein